MNNALFFKDKSGHVFMAIHQDFYIRVELFSWDISIEKCLGEYASKLRLKTCANEYEYTKITDEEFVDAICKAHSILLDIPYL